MTDHTPTEAELRDELQDAPEAENVVPFNAGDGDDGPPPFEGPDYDPPEYEGRPMGEIFDGSPVRALGVNGDASFYLDTKGQLRAVDNHTKQKMLHVFGGRVGLLSQHFPQFTKGSDKPSAGDFNQLKLSVAMIGACEERGVWSPVGKVRGAGAWTDEDGRLVYHAGDAVLIDGNWYYPGEYEGYVYPASDRVPRPADTAGSAALEVLDLLGSWNWSRPDLDPMLALGAICAQLVGGALEWRPVTWLTGDQATGKSTFQRMLRYLHGGSAGLLQASDATEAGIRSVIGYSSLPVALDELEPDDDPKRGKAAAIIRLARIAASGDQILRGSTDQKGYQGNAYSCFVFSSILVPPLPPQDRSRLIMLDLNRLEKTASKPKDDARRLKRLGAQLRRAMIDRWPQFQERLELWRGALAQVGKGGRVADNYGTVLALADMALHETLPLADDLEKWAGILSHRLQSEDAEGESNADNMLVHLMSQPLDVWRKGRRFNVASWLAMAARLPRAPEQIDSADHTNANSYLAPFGLRVKGQGENAELYLANKPINGLAQLFEGTPWADGVWTQAARRINGAEPCPSALTFARVPSRAYKIPFTSIPGLLNTMDEVRGDPTPQRYLGDGIEGASE